MPIIRLPCSAHPLRLEHPHPTPRAMTPLEDARAGRLWHAGPKEGRKMKSVSQIFADVLAMQRQGRHPLAIRDLVIELGHDAGFARLIDTGSGESIRIDFGNREVIAFDGARWHHERLK